jgi:hypothetical protein
LPAAPSRQVTRSRISNSLGFCCLIWRLTPPSCQQR